MNLSLRTLAASATWPMLPASADKRSIAVRLTRGFNKGHSMTHWQPYKPNDAEPWDLRRVVHLHRRVVFGPAWSEIERDLKDDPQQAVSRVLNKECRQQCVPDDSLKLANLIGDSAAQSLNPERLKALLQRREHRHSNL